jgi:outer membrane biosynthesis protein TonB
MLNPLAHDFTPISSFPIEPSSTPTQKTKKKKQSEAKPKSKKNPPPLIKAETSTKPQKNKESRANNKKDPHHARVTHNNKAKQKSTQPIQPNLGDMFEKESKFITIEAAIDPIHRTDPASLNTIHTNKTISSDKQSVLEHGYERYLDWVKNNHDG